MVRLGDSSEAVPLSDWDCNVSKTCENSVTKQVLEALVSNEAFEKIMTVCSDTHEPLCVIQGPVFVQVAVELHRACT